MSNEIETEKLAWGARGREFKSHRPDHFQLFGFQMVAASKSWPELCLLQTMTSMAHKVVNRSNLYRLITTISPINHSLIARKDAWGGVVVMGLLVGVLNLMRLLLAN